MTDREMYIDWVNNFLTVARFAEYYGMTEKQAKALIERERAKVEYGICNSCSHDGGEVGESCGVCHKGRIVKKGDR